MTVSFGVIDLIPGDPALAILGTSATQNSLANLREELGLNDPLLDRYLAYIGRTVRGDLGESYFSRTPVSAEILRTLPNTIELIVPALILAMTSGLLIGILAAYFAGTKVDRAVRASINIAQSSPDFVVALLAIYLLFFVTGLVPAPVGRTGIGTVSVPSVTGFLYVDSIIAGRWDALLDGLRRSVLPVATLGFVYSAYFAKITRATMKREFEADHVEFARARGMPERIVIRYALSTARTPILTYGALLFGALVGGAAIVETIFAWGGLGEWALRAILNVDVPAIRGFILVSGLFTLVLFIVLDLAVSILDPRVRYE